MDDDNPLSNTIQEDMELFTEEVSKVNEPWAKDSIYFIAFVSNESTSEIELWGVEIKSRQTHQTRNMNT
jgi:hypothetical protein